MASRHARMVIAGGCALALTATVPTAGLATGPGQGPAPRVVAVKAAVVAPQRSGAGGRIVTLEEFLGSEIDGLHRTMRPGSVWDWSGSGDCFRCNAGVGLAAAALYASSGHRRSLERAVRILDKLVTYSQDNGAFAASRAEAGTNADVATMFAAAELGLAVQLIGDDVDGTTRRRWSDAVTGAADFLIRNKNLTWYTNGNIVVGNALVMALAHRLSGESRFATAYEQAWSFAVSPGARWPDRGFRVVRRPGRTDGADGKGYFTETGVAGTGYDADYAMLQLDQLARLLLVTRDPRVLRATNMVFNQLRDRLEMRALVLETGRGTRHPQVSRPVAFDSAGLAVLAQVGGRKDLMPYVDAQLGVSIRAFRGLRSHYGDRATYALGMIFTSQLAAAGAFDPARARVRPATPPPPPVRAAPGVPLSGRGAR